MDCVNVALRCIPAPPPKKNKKQTQPQPPAHQKKLKLKKQQQNKQQNKQTCVQKFSLPKCDGLFSHCVVLYCHWY